MICSAHMGVWELLPEVLSRRLPAYALRRGFFVYRPLHNVLLDRWLCRRRERAARMAAPRCGSIGVLRSALKDGGVVGSSLISDRAMDMLPSGRPFWRAQRLQSGALSLHHTTGAPVWLAVCSLRHWTARLPCVCTSRGWRRAVTSAHCSLAPTGLRRVVRCHESQRQKQDLPPFLRWTL